MTGRVVVLGAGVAGLTTALSLARGGITVDVLERDRAQAPLGRRSAATWVRDGAPQAQHAHVFGPGFHRLLCSELPDVLTLLLAAGARELPLPGHGAALALRRPLFDWVLRRVAEREPRVRVHCGMPVRGLRSDGSRLTGVLVEGGVLAADVAVDATGSGTRTASWLADLGYSSAHPPRPSGLPSSDRLPTTTYYSRCYSLRWPGDTGAVDFGVAAGGAFQGYRCHAVPGDNDTFTVTFALPGSSVDPAVMNGAGPSALRQPDGFQAAAEHVPVISEWVDRRTADPLTAVAVLRDWPQAADRGVAGLAALPGLVAVGDARGVPEGTGGNGVARAMAQGLACASAILEASGPSSAELERPVARASFDDPGLPEPRHHPLSGPDILELAHIAASAGAGARISA